MNGSTKRALAPIALLLVFLLALTAAGAGAEVYGYDYLYVSVAAAGTTEDGLVYACLLYTSPSPRDRTRSRMPSSA